MWRCGCAQLSKNKWRCRGKPSERANGRSVGRYNNATLLDLDYSEDSLADADLNIVMLEGGRFVEVQGTAEGLTFDRISLKRC